MTSATAVPNNIIDHRADAGFTEYGLTGRQDGADNRIPRCAECGDSLTPEDAAQSPLCDWCWRKQDAELHRECANCAVLLSPEEKAHGSICNWCREYRETADREGCEECTGPITATDRADFQLVCRRCRELNRQRGYGPRKTPTVRELLAMFGEE